MLKSARLVSKLMSESKKTRVIQRLSLYSDDCRQLLNQSLDLQPEEPSLAFAAAMPYHKAFAGGRFADSSSDEDEERPGTGNSSPATSDSEEESNDIERQNKPSQPPPTERSAIHQTGTITAKTQATKQKLKIDPKQHEANTRKHIETLTCHALPLKEPEKSELHVASSLLSKEERYANGGRTLAIAFLNISNRLGKERKPVLVLFLRSGRFAGAVFRQGKCTHHRTAQRYTVRKGQGKAQSVQDSQRRPKSMGSQLRRAGEEQLKEDIRDTLRSWKDEVEAAALVFISCPKTMKKSLYDSMEPIIGRDDNRIRRVPLDLGRPTFENVVLIHDVLLSPTVREAPLEKPSESEEQKKGELASIRERISDEENVTTKAGETKQPIIPLSAMHIACKNGDLYVLREILSSKEDDQDVNLLAGEDFMTPLHYAAQSVAGGGHGDVDPTVAAAMVLELLENGKADPTRVDGRNRPGYFLASNEKVRDAFRIARARLGEESCDWEKARVGPALTPEDVEKRQVKEAEKKRNKKKRQKEKKAKEKAQQQEMEQRRRDEEEKETKAQEAKRIRDGLLPKTNTAPNVCDFCQKVCKGRQRSQMYNRLEYAYCSSECVQKHKRELVAAAAMSRFRK
mmetsp:Transcript_20782/g.45006  ORF Transcript_20782/g.45006 Transcript_20782/m.45006 type:complete len:626 (-) Transcript_20782:110-1987(-)